MNNKYLTIAKTINLKVLKNALAISIVLFSLQLSFTAKAQCPTNAICYTHTSGDIETELNTTVSNTTASPCPGVAAFSIPAGMMVTEIDVAYNMISTGGGFMSEQRSYLFSPNLGIGESAVASGVGGSGTFNYNRTGLNFADGATDTLELELRAFRTWGGTTGCNTTYGYVENNSWELIIFLDSIPDCYDVTNVSVLGATGSQATLSWSDVNTSAVYLVEYDTAGFTPGTGTVDTAFTNSYTITGLQDTTNYDVYVQAICNMTDLSSQVGPVSFTTCSGMAICFTHTAGDIPTERLLASNINNTTVSPCPGETTIIVPPGLMIVGIDLSYNMLAQGGAWMAEQRSYLYSPSLGKGEPEVYAGASNTAGNFSYNRTGLDFAWGATDTVDFELRAFRTFGTSPDGCNTVYNYVINNTWEMLIYLDSIPDCFPVSDIALDSVSGTTASLSWVDNDIAATWVVEYGLSGFAQGTGVYDTVTATLHTLTGLLENNFYDVYVQALCSTVDISNWTGPFTFQTECVTPLSGYFTVDATGSGDYATISEAIDNLLVCGIDGPVVIAVFPGVYEEQVYIPEIPGVSANNTVTIIGDDPSTTIVEFDNVTSDDRYVFRLDGAKHLTIENLTITSDASLAWGIHMTNECEYINILNNHIEVGQTETGASNQNGIIASGSNTSAFTGGVTVNHLLIEGNTIIGGYYNIRLNGVAATRSQNIIVKDNVLQDFRFYSTYFINIENLVVDGNNISRPTRSDVSTFYGVYFTSTTQATVTNNRIHNPFGGGGTALAYGIYITGSNTDLSSPHLIANNLIYNFNNNPTSTTYGIYQSTSSGTLIYNNTIALDSDNKTTGASYGYYQISTASDVEFKNNIVYINTPGTGIVRGIWFGSTLSSITSDHNVIWVEGQGTEVIVGRYGTTNYETLLDWQTSANGGIYDANSFEEDPLFLNPNLALYLPLNADFNDLGDTLTLPLVPTDINGVMRGFPPDIGAFEFDIAPTDVGPVAITSPAQNVCYTDEETITVALVNFGLDTLDFANNTADVDVVITGPTGPQNFSAVLNTGLLAPGDTLEFTVTNLADLSDTGTYSMAVSVDMVGDLIALNDEISDIQFTFFTGTAFVPSDEACYASTVTVSLDGATITDGIQWQTFDGTNWVNDSSATAFTPEFEIQLFDTTSIRAVVCNDFITNEVSIAVDFIEDPVIIQSGVRCGPGEVTMIATAGFDVAWYTNINDIAPFHIGDTLTVTLSDTTTYYIANSEGITENAGKSTPDGTANTSTTTGNWGLVFDVINQDIVLQTVDVYSVSTAGELSVNLTDDQGNVLQTAGPFTYPGGTTTNPTIVTLNLNFNVPVGTGYRIVNTNMSGGNLIREFSDPGFPYISSSGNIEITSGYLSSPNQTYYWFYNWQVSSGCEGERIPITANVAEPVAIDILATATEACAGDEITFVASSMNTNYNYEWLTSQGAAYSGDTVQTAMVSEDLYIVLFAEDLATTCTAVDTLDLMITPNPVIDFTISDTLVCEGLSSELTLEILSIESDSLLFEDFEGITGLPTGWTGASVFNTTFNVCSGDRSIRTNLFSSAQSRTLTLPSVNLSTFNLQLLFDYKVIDFSGGNPTTGDWGVVNLQYSIDGGTNWTTVLTIDENNHVVSASCSSMVAAIPYASFAGESDIIFRFDMSWNSGDFYVYLDNIAILQDAEQEFVINWDNPSLVAEPDSFFNVVTPAVTTTYGVSVTEVLTGCISETKTVTLNVSPVPVVNLGPDRTICDGDVTMLTSGHPNLDILWNTGDTINQIEVSSQGIYGVVVTNSDGCFGSDSLSVVFNPSPSTGLDSLISVCENNNVSITPNPGYITYEWTGDIISENPSVSFVAGSLEAGTYDYNLKVVNQFGCEDQEDLVLEILNAPQINVGEDANVCQDEVRVFDAGVENATYTWSGAVSGNEQTLTFDANQFGLGIYEIDLLVEFDNGCFDTERVSVAVQFCVGIDELNIASLNVYPNPSAGLFNLEINAASYDGIFIEVYDMLGRNIGSLSREITGSMTPIDLSNQADGIYMLRIMKDGEMVYQKRLVKQ